MAVDRVDDRKCCIIEGLLFFVCSLGYIHSTLYFLVLLYIFHSSFLISHPASTFLQPNFALPSLCLGFPSVA